MKSSIMYAIATLLPVLAAIFLYLLNKYTRFGALKENVKQLVYGLIFGGLAVLGTEWGIPLNGAQVNCRDAAVLTAGLLFGAPAGIIAGVIGAVERWFSVYWGIGAFTRVACSLSTLIAGIYAALLRKFMFENKKPGWFISLAIGVVMEVFHVTMVFITNMDTPTEAMNVVRACSVPLIVGNAVSVLFATVSITLISTEHFSFRKPQRVRISQTIQRWLLVAVVLAFAATSVFVFNLQDALATRQADTLLEQALTEVSDDISDAMHSGKDINLLIVDLTKNRHVGETGAVIVVDSEYDIVSLPAGMKRETLQEEIPDIMSVTSGEDTFECIVNGDYALCRYEFTEGFYLISVLPEAEAWQMRNIAIYVNTFMEVLVFAILFGLVYLLIKKVVVNRIKTINDSLSRITGGDLGVVVDVRYNEEFASLSDDINSTVSTLKRYIDEASARIDKELEFAKSIQSSALPSVFPAFPRHKDFDIYALMSPAREVGGDFYDFYLTNEDALHFLIADVSGKGIPAAMFMMRAKTELKTLTETALPVSDVFTHGNEALCEGNDAGMFVTAWQGGLDLATGTVRFANAGHNPPLVRHADGKFEYLRSRAGFVLAGMEGVRYRAQELQLAPGDVIFLYTDGVTEATDAENRLFGETRLLDTLNGIDGDADMHALCDTVKAAVDAFVGGAPQFDDITMVALRYVGTPPVPAIRFEEAAIADIPAVTEFIEAELEKLDCPMKIVTQISIAIDEIYSNIVKYAYAETKGPAEVALIAEDAPRTVYIRFTDEGIPYNPVTKEDPDVTLSAEDRKIGGLGIYMVKKTMDDMTYKYENGKNVLTLKKYLA